MTDNSLIRTFQLFIEEESIFSTDLSNFTSMKNKSLYIKHMISCRDIKLRIDSYKWF